MTRNPAVSGMFYPKDPIALHHQVQDYLRDAEDFQIDGKLKALIVPHAGYQYSGLVAAHGYKLLLKQKFSRVIIIGPAHHANFYGASFSKENFATPLGEVKVIVPENFIDGELIIDLPRAHDAEHSLEVQLPFLQETLGGFELCPIVVGSVDDKELAVKISKHLGSKTLLIASSDLSHYCPYDKAVLRDNDTIGKILRLESENLEACGEIPIRVILHLARTFGWKAHLIDYHNSGDTAGDKERVVGYAAIAFTSEK